MRAILSQSPITDTMTIKTRPCRFVPRLSSRFYSSMSVSVPPEMLLNAWLRHHLFMLGFDKIKLHTYQKLQSLISQGGGGVLKNLVFDMSLFVKREWPANRELAQLAPAPNLGAYAHIADFRWFYISLGYMMLTEPDTKVQAVSDKVVEVYLRLGATHVVLDAPVGPTEKTVLRLAAAYYKALRIHYRALYDPHAHIREVPIGSGACTITLPALPQIRSKHLLAKALLHKELSRAVFLENHPFRAVVASHGVPVDLRALTVVRHDLSFLDGLGDFVLATESSAFLYRFRQLAPYCDDVSFGKKTYTLLKNILATNTLLLRLAVAYNLHTALGDDIVTHMLTDAYIPHIWSGTVALDPLVMRYEEEFVADYFEQYVGALYLEQPHVAQAWLTVLFERILFLISDDYRVEHRRKKPLPCHYDYRAWGVDMIGRSI